MRQYPTRLLKQVLELRLQGTWGRTPVRYELNGEVLEKPLCDVVPHSVEEIRGELLQREMNALGSQTLARTHTPTHRRYRQRGRRLIDVLPETPVTLPPPVMPDRVPWPDDPDPSERYDGQYIHITRKRLTHRWLEWHAKRVLLTPQPERYKDQFLEVIAAWRALTRQPLPGTAQQALKRLS